MASTYNGDHANSLLKELSSKLSNGRHYIDTHCHLSSTLEAYRHSSKITTPAEKDDIPDFVNSIFPKELVAVIDIFCEPPFHSLPSQLAASAAWRSGFKYFFAAGCHPHNAKDYTDEIEQEIIRSMQDDKAKAWYN